MFSFSPNARFMLPCEGTSRTATCISQSKVCSASDFSHAIEAVSVYECV